MDVATDTQTTPTASISAGAVAASRASTEQHRLLMSRDHMNLAAVRTRAQDVQKTIMQATFDLETAPDQYDWANVLERFTVMNAQLHSIRSQMLPLLEHYVVHPKAVDQQMAPVLPIMLASTLLPEQEEQHQEQLKDLQQQQGPIGRRQQAAYAQRMTDSINKLVDYLTVPQEGVLQSGMLDANKGQLRREIGRTSCMPKKSPPGTQRAGAGQSLSAGRKLEGRDLFLAVATKGHGIARPA